MTSNQAQRRHSLARSSVVYFGSVFAIGLPVMSVAYRVFVGILDLLHLGWFVPSAGGIIVVAAAFVAGMWVAGTVATTLANRLH